MSKFKERLAALTKKSSADEYTSHLDEALQTAIDSAAQDIGIEEDLAGVYEQIVNDLLYDHKVDINDVFHKVGQAIEAWKKDTENNFPKEQE